MKLKENLKFYLTARGMSAAELSRTCKLKTGVNVPKATISNWLAGGAVRNLEAVHSVSRVLSVSVDDLLFGDPTRSQTKKNQGGTVLDLLITDQSEGWLTGRFEIKLRRLKDSD